MFKLLIKNSNLSIVFLLFYIPSFTIDFKNPKQISGNFQGALYLKIDPHRKYTLSHRKDQSGSFSYRWYLNQRTNKVQIKIRSKGQFSILLEDQKHKISSQNWNDFEIPFTFNTDRSHIDLTIYFHKSQIAEIETIEIDQKIHAFDAKYLYKNQETIKKNDLDLDFPLGINLEAEYLFSDLKEEQWKDLLIQVKKDGFNSLRIHKVYRQYQKEGVFFLKKFQKFLEVSNAYPFSIYLDLLSYPLGGNHQDGWKQDIYLYESLQNDLDEWIQTLSTIKVDHANFFEWKKLKFLCLVNENSLFFEESSQSLNRFNSLLLKARSKKWITRKNFKFQIMSKFYQRLSRKLRELNYQGKLFLSNYQLGTEDLEINQHLSSEVDRHLYLDYPIFFQKIVKVKNENPIEHLNKLKKHILEISPQRGLYLSEFNLPWPNRFQHTLIPILLFLNHLRPIKGLWFYDYRLRSKDFHLGGLFGIQRFRSIISQLPYLAELLKSDYQVTWNQNELWIRSQKLLALSTMKFENKVEKHFTIWKNCQNSKIEVFTLERAEGDLFDATGQIQIKRGQKAQELDLSVKLRQELETLLKCRVDRIDN
ncbi:hypothetical protein MJH12_13705 [bacterium]|nr:hypothetical protein [bacterium]